jgi:hypothetical protein
VGIWRMVETLPGAIRSRDGEAATKSRRLGRFPHRTVARGVVGAGVYSGRGRCHLQRPPERNVPFCPIKQDRVRAGRSEA